MLELRHPILLRRTDMTKGDLIDKVAKDADISGAQAKKVVDSVFDSITKALKKKETVTLVGFGAFSVSRRSARTGRNPKTGEEIKIKAQNSPKFKAGKALKDAVR
ncbi:MAG: HU family DNA-binding protein [Betaproteobacteria bacterium AqS2]|uniref:HU family DNA-binding protein n=1 Tax=Candidatus Amphirhobacter heronislandensis TaxID=1732024 RepID=A0A930UF20_9GAMM|nr:HU family DNA-binding protein [Betaproteobacteria bacterium AqS2]